jgi:hypothetical protein
MKVAIHQPQYFPWLPYFLKINKADLFIFLDSVDFHKNGIQNRNMIKTSQGEKWLTVPVKHTLGQKIKDIEIDNTKKWQKKHYQTLSQSYSKAEFFNDYKSELESFFTNEWSSLSEMNINLLSLMMKWLKIETPIIRSSEMNSTGKGSDLILNLCCEVRASKYVSGIGGKDYLDSNMFKKMGILIDYQPPILPNQYPQLHQKIGFKNNLSILDIILNCGESWKSYIPK